MKHKTKTVADVAPWNERLDAAVKDAWPFLECETRLDILSMRWITRWWKAGTDSKKLSPSLDRQVKAFVRGFFSACESGGEA